MSPEQYFNILQTALQAQANPDNAAQMKRYMKNRFDFFGIKTPERKAISRKLFSELGIPQGQDLKQLCRLCFTADERECQYFVNDILQRNAKKLDPSFIDLVEELLPLKTWWDSVDFLAPKIAGRGIMLRYPEVIDSYTDRWIESENFWFQRSAIIFQLDFKDKTREDLLFKYILRRADSTEFFVQKGAGWGLREYSKTNPEAVIEFIENNELPKLTVREGLKWVERTSGRTSLS